ncbi:pseudouridine synthase [Gemmobacter lanyuensis]|uniref:Pseudouridine synthase n=1 Tax=Gemmobacter lanyuensis TaxID=1054497 RepID=A0A918J0G6_9RHOB|nr:RluA family pseudouridine synthase [Gemmobacter lanyuensis]GGW40419.1 pseudouridine synthase [Gemmobacter lanyuensis]
MPPYAYNPPDVPLSILHHDSALLIVDKPAGLLSVPGKDPGKEDCLIDRLRRVFPEVLLVHRLDCDTSGVMVFALTKAVQGNLGQQFEKRQTKKIYVARLAGRLEPKEGTVDLPLCVDWPNRPRQHVNHEIGKPAITDYRVVRYDGNTTRVRLMPQTGRSHQLRVHMLELGHPILGDQIYAEGADRDAHPRMMLHAESLRLRHPETGKSVTFSAPAPF